METSSSVQSTGVPRPTDVSTWAFIVCYSQKLSFQIDYHERLSRLVFIMGAPYQMPPSSFQNWLIENASEPGTLSRHASLDVIYPFFQWTSSMFSPSPIWILTLLFLSEAKLDTTSWDAETLLLHDPSRLWAGRKSTCTVINLVSSTVSTTIFEAVMQCTSLQSLIIAGEAIHLFTREEWWHSVDGTRTWSRNRWRTLQRSSSLVSYSVLAMKLFTRFSGLSMLMISYDSATRTTSVLFATRQEADHAVYRDGYQQYVGGRRRIIEVLWKRNNF